ncbi:MAG: hypothetical protein GWO00_15455, partial [Gemmatimonadetes bacterium]|nr:hypothetical protein [Gemmatimonadota bacterium]NIU32226.1 hypothetical protein [Gemmatimonadota bacterium]NIW65325.1 hypothetical protein [Gemmatimonadota bacterium]NIX40654.1 hypothetical protein [Gemmatimonadota bacterium]
MELLSIKRRPGASGYPKALENLLRQQQHDRVGALLDEPETSHRFHGALAASSDEDLW